MRSREKAGAASDCGASCFVCRRPSLACEQHARLHFVFRIWSRISLKAEQLTNGRPADGGLRKWDCGFESRSLQRRVIRTSITPTISKPHYPVAQDIRRRGERRLDRD